MEDEIINPGQETDSIENIENSPSSRLVTGMENEETPRLLCKFIPIESNRIKWNIAIDDFTGYGSDRLAEIEIVVEFISLAPCKFLRRKLVVSFVRDQVVSAGGEKETITPIEVSDGGALVIIILPNDNIGRIKWPLGY